MMREPPRRASHAVSGWRGARAARGLALALALASCIGGQTGSEGAHIQVPAAPPECTSSDQCAAKIEARLAAFRAPRKPAGAYRLLSAQCKATLDCDNLSATTCVCTSALEHSDATQVFMLGGPKCALYGRALDCLMPAEELAPCQVGGCECEQACTRALELRAEEDARERSAELRAARCDREKCRTVVQLPAGCVDGAALISTVAFASRFPLLSCSLSDDELLWLPGAPAGRYCGAGGSSSIAERAHAGADACAAPAQGSAP